MINFLLFLIKFFFLILLTFKHVIQKRTYSIQGDSPSTLYLLIEKCICLNSDYKNF